MQETRSALSAVRLIRRAGSGWQGITAALRRKPICDPAPPVSLSQKQDGGPLASPSLEALIRGRAVRVCNRSPLLVERYARLHMALSKAR